jgi:hypothetical protein
MDLQQRKKRGNSDVPMGSTKKVGASVRGGRVPEEYDSSPTLYSKRLGERKRHKCSAPEMGMGGKRILYK